MVSGSNRGEKLSTIKLTVVQYGILLMMLALGAGLWRLQVLDVQNYRVLAQQNRIRQEPILAPRGKLFDRFNRIIVDDYPSVTCFLVREQSKSVEADLPLIAKGLDLNLDDLRATLHRYRSQPGYQPIPIKDEVTPDEQAFIAAHRNELPELETIDVERRLYPRDGFAAHLIGYVGEVSEEDLNNPRFAYYEPGDVVGKAGVEETYDELLRGQDGSREVIVDSHGREVGYFGIQHSVPGQDLRLTIDNDLQRAAELALGDREGAIVAMDPRNGEILAMVSRPSFDPNAFAIKIDRTEWNKLISDPEHPLLNKAIQAQLAPGSTFKVLMSVAGLQEGVAQNLHVFCNGGADFYGHFYHCDRHHGPEDIETAIPDSCDTFFYTLADKLGIDTISRYAKMFGFGQKTGIDMPDEEPGLMPSAEWVMRTFHHKWYAGETISVGIGQGAIEATPIQLARYISGVASGGHMVRPHVVSPNELPPEFYKGILESFPGSGDAYVPIDAQNWMTITDAMAQITEPGPFHTAVSAHLSGIDLAGKTGTAEVISDAFLKASGLKGKATAPNVWFVGVVPRRNPELVVAVLWMHGDFSYYPARIGAQVVKAFVDEKRREAHNLPPNAPASPVEVGAVWSVPNPLPGKSNSAVAHTGSRFEGGHFFVEEKGIVATNAAPSNPALKLKTKPAAARSAATFAAGPAEMASALAIRRKGP